MSALKVGLIGCGHIAHLVHLKILTRLPGIELVALAEPDPQRSNSFFINQRKISC
jgi:predicted dehydrogenase